MQIRRFGVCLVILAAAGCGGESKPPANPKTGYSIPPAAGSTVNGGSATDVVTRKTAEVGVGRKSQNIKGGGYYATVIRARHRMTESLTLSQTKQALQIYKAINEGRGPATHEEYMEKVIKENYIKLPELPEGQRYQYDPETEELMVEELAPNKSEGTYATGNLDPYRNDHTRHCA